MAKKFVRGVTGVEDIESFDKSLTNINDLISDGKNTYVHTKKGKNEFYYKVTDGVTSVNSTGGTITVEKRDDGTVNLNTNPQKVLEHDNLLVAEGLTKKHSSSEELTTISLNENVMDTFNNTITSHGNMWQEIKPTPYNDLNTLPINSIVTYSSKSNVSNCPNIVKNGFTIITFTGLKDKNRVGSVQICFTPDATSCFRMVWYIGGTEQWTEWTNLIEEQNKYPLALELFENIAVIGDSYSSGELIPDATYEDYYNISWIQLLARKHGLKATNYSSGGLQTRTWLTSKYGLQKMEQDTPKDLYFIYLGINDNNVLVDNEIGNINDIGTENDTFYGNYAKIINHVITKSPKAKIALINMNETTSKVYVPINNIAQHFNLPVLDLSKDTLTNSYFYKNEMKGGHPQALGYATLAGAIERLLQQSFNNNNSYWINYIPQTT